MPLGCSNRANPVESEVAINSETITVYYINEQIFTMSEMELSQKFDAIASDCGFTGKLVCGPTRFQQLSKYCSPIAKIRNVYNFGKGSAEPISRWNIQITVGGITKICALDVIKNPIPLLCGLEFGFEFGIWVDMADKLVFQEMNYISNRNRDLNSVTLVNITHKYETSLPTMKVKFGTTAGKKSATAGLSATDTSRNTWNRFGALAEPNSEELDTAEVEGSFRPKRCLVPDHQATRQRSRTLPKAEAKKGGGDVNAMTAAELASLLAGLPAVEAETGDMAGQGSPLSQKSTRRANRHGKARKSPKGKAEKSDFGQIFRNAPGKSKTQMPQIFRLTTAQLLKLHCKTHTPGETLFRYLRRTLAKKTWPVYKRQLRNLRKTLRKIQSKCRGCNNFKRRQRRTTKFRKLPSWRRRGWVDLFCLNNSKQLWAACFVEESSALMALQVLRKRDAANVYEAYESRWASRWGHFEHLVSDIGGELVAKEFIALCDQNAVFKSVTAGESSESHGKVERAIGSVRFSLDKMENEKELQYKNYSKGWNTPEWVGALNAIENTYNNTLDGRSNYTPSQRACGRNTSMALNILGDTPASATLSPHDLVKVQDYARESYRTVLYSRTVRSALREKAQSQPLGFEIGQKVYYFRRGEKHKGRKISWYGPATIIGKLLGDQDDKTYWYQVDHGGNLLKIHPLDLRLDDDNSPLPLEQDDSDSEKDSESDDEQDEAPEQRQTDTAAIAKLFDPKTPTPVFCCGGCGDWHVEDCDRCGHPTCSECGMWHGTHEKCILVCKHCVGFYFNQKENAVPQAPPAPSTSSKPKGILVTQNDVSVQKVQENSACNVQFFAMDKDDEDYNWYAKTKTDKAFLWSISKRGDKYWDLGLVEHKLNNIWTQELLIAGSEAPSFACVHANSTINTTYLNSQGHAVMLATTEGLTPPEHVYASTWSDVSPLEQQRAIERALNDYDKWNAWDRTSDRPYDVVKRDKTQVVLSGRWVLKPKMVDGLLVGRARWTPRGFQDSEAWDTDSPTTQGSSHRILETIGLQREWVRFNVDFSEAFFQSTPTTRKNLWVEVPTEDLPAGAPKMVRRLLIEVPGTKMAPRAWFETIRSKLISKLGCQQSKIDPAIFYIRDNHGKLVGYLPLHVDDTSGRIDPNLVHWLEKTLKEHFLVGLFNTQGTGDVSEFIGQVHEECADGSLFHQIPYILNKLKPMNITKERAKQREHECTENEITSFRSANGGLMWVGVKSRPDALYESSIAASAVNCLRVKHCLRLNKTIRKLQLSSDPDFRQLKIKMPRLPNDSFEVKGIVDAGEGEEVAKEGYSHSRGGYLIGIGCEGSDAFSPVTWRAGKVRRVTQGAFDAECVEALDCTDVLLGVAELISEALNGVEPSLKIQREMRRNGEEWAPIQPKGILYTDSKCLVDQLKNVRMPPQVHRRRRKDIANLKETLASGELKQVVHIEGKLNPADPLTKERTRNGVRQTLGELYRILETGAWTPPTT